MKAALVVPRVSADSAANLATIERMTLAAISSEAELVVLPEAALTGLVISDSPSHDLPLGETIPGPATDRLGKVCSQHGVWLGFGMLEREGNRLYDSAVLLGPDGLIRLRYRRIDPHWHGEDANPDVYCQGSAVDTTDSRFGKLAFLVCGDLFDDGIASRFLTLGADWLLYPFARCFSDGTADQVRWDTEELPEYVRRVRMIKTPALMVNYLADGSLHHDCSFGGAFVISAEGEVFARQPLGEDGVLIVDLELAYAKRRSTAHAEPSRGNQEEKLT